MHRRGPVPPPGVTEAARLRHAGDALHRAAAVVARLEAAGWAVTWYLIFALAEHPGVRTRAEARRRLADLGIDPADVEVQKSPA